ncbi:MAG: hypothetical protein K2M31_00030, partial [Muribaculaceae bacterium]|nr:hypothetical protein [Muribaculaceae bacterium]
MNNKIQIDALPCKSGSFKTWFSIMIACAVIGVVLNFIMGYGKVSWLLYVIPFVSIIGTVSGIIYNVIFAKSLKAVSNSLYGIMMALAFLPILSSGAMISMLINPDSTSYILLGIVSGIALILGIVFIVKVCSNYSGELGKLGRNMWLVPLLSIGAIIAASLLSVLFSSISDNSYESSSFLSMLLMIVAVVYI